jgi:hypothetical protein
MDATHYLVRYQKIHLIWLTAFSGVVVDQLVIRLNLGGKLFGYKKLLIQTNA